MGNRASIPLKDIHVNGQLPAAEEISGKATANCFVSSEWGNPSRNTDVEKPSKENESTKEPSLLQYLCVQSPAGKGCHHVLESLAAVRSRIGFLNFCLCHLTQSGLLMCLSHFTLSPFVFSIYK